MINLLVLNPVLRYLDVVGLSVVSGVFAAVSAGVFNAGKLMSPNSSMGVC